MKNYPLDQIKDRLLVIDYARNAGLPVSRPGDRCAASWRGGDNASSVLFDERHYYDFGAGHGGDVIDLAMQMGGIGFREAVAQCARMAGVAIDQDNGRQTDPDDLTAIAYDYHAALTSDDWAYMHGRGLTDQTIKRLAIGRGDHRLGMQDRITIPYWQGGRALYMVGRGTDPKYKKMRRDPLSRHPIWGIDTLNREGAVVLAEGIIDAIVCYQEGHAVLTAVTGGYSGEQMKDLPGLLRGRRVIIALDYDPVSQTGQKCTKKLGEQLLDARIYPYAVALEGDGKKSDLAEIYQQKGEIKTTLDTAQPFALTLIDEIGADPDGFERLMWDLSEWAPGPEIARLLAHAKQSGRFDAAWLTALAKLIQRPPTDDMIVRRIEKKKSIIFHEQLGWFEYGSGVWKTKAETEIRAYIADELSGARTGPRISSVSTVARAAWVRQKPLNEYHLINMRNGMLDPETREITAHAPSYYSSIQLNYDYDPTCTAPKWEQFINEIADGDRNRQLFLQEMFGYCLTSDTRYQVAFFLMGEGGNGKSQFLRILESVIGVDNCSHVEINALQHPFERIALHGSLVNICAEVKTDVSEASEIFKKSVTNDMISACYKHKDFIRFRPFCKFVVALNKHIESSDATRGFGRRLMFVRFPVEFVADPKKPHHRQARPENEIIADLMDELPGILNWALDGLTALRARGGFIQTLDNAELNIEYQELNNPVMLWWEEYSDRIFFGEWLCRDRVYGDYREFMTSGGSFPISARRFWPMMRSMLRELMEERRLANTREVKFSAES